MLASCSAELLEAAVELEAIGEIGVPDPAADDQVLRLLVRCGVDFIVAGLVLAHLGRSGEFRAKLFMQRIEVPLRCDLVGVMIAVQPQASTRILGAGFLRDALEASGDIELHELIASALASHVVVDSDICLPVLRPAARYRLATALAERAGRSIGFEPSWMINLGPVERSRVFTAFCFGLLCGRFADNFVDVVDRLGETGWHGLRKSAQNRAVEMTRRGIDIYISMCATHAPASIETASKLSRPPISSADDFSRSFAGSELCRRAKTAAPEEIELLIGLANRMVSQTWGLEVKLTLLRRALDLDLRISPFAFRLRRPELGAEIAAARIVRGDLRPLRTRSWERIGLDRRFQILSCLIAIGDDAAVSVDVLVDPVLAMPDAMRGILVERLLVAFGQSGAMTNAHLARFADEGQNQDEVLVLLARTYALRGETAASKATMRRAEVAAAVRRNEDVNARLLQIFDDPENLPGGAVPAVASALSMIGGAGLPGALALCASRLDVEDFQKVMADLIVRGRAIEAFTEIL